MGEAVGMAAADRALGIVTAAIAAGANSGAGVAEGGKMPRLCTTPDRIKISSAP